MSIIEELQAKFGREEAVSFACDHGDLVCVNLRTERGAAARLSLYGGHLLSWRTSDAVERLFLSSQALFRPGKAIRGGVPIVFPQFGAGPIVAHGFARTSLWAVVGSDANRGQSSVTVSLNDSAETRAVWPHKFRLDLTVTLTDTLSTELWIENTDEHPWECSYLFHTYLKVEDIRTVGVMGLLDHEYLDKVAGGARHRESGAVLPIDRLVDRIYLGAPDDLLVGGVRGGESLRLMKQNLRDVVVWNPWKDKTPSFTDLAPDDYTHFVCVEAGSVGEPVVIPPGERVVCGQTLRIEKRAE